jgi:stalled ribosome alternative rescue factor ArfA
MSITEDAALVRDPLFEKRVRVNQSGEVSGQRFF